MLRIILKPSQKNVEAKSQHLLALGVLVVMADLVFRHTRMAIIMTKKNW